MMDWLNQIKNTLKKVPQLPAGTFAATCYTQENLPYKLLLRIDQDGTGRLVVNARTLLFLNQTSTEYIYHYINNKYGDEVVGYMQAKYRIGRDEVLGDYQALVEQIESLLGQEDLAPLTNLQGVSVGSSGFAPVKVSFYPTLKLRIGESPRKDDNLPLDWWATAMKKAMDQGVAHFVLAGGDPVHWSGVEGLVKESETLGVVMGMVTWQRSITPTLIDSLVNGGLDHLAILIPIGQQPDWDLLANIAKKNLYYQVVFEIDDQNLESVLMMIPECKKHAITNIGFEAMETLPQVEFEKLFDVIDEYGLVFVPFMEMMSRDGIGDDLTRYSGKNGEERYEVVVMPDGSVRSLIKGVWQLGGLDL